MKVFVLLKTSRSDYSENKKAYVFICFLTPPSKRKPDSENSVVDTFENYSTLLQVMNIDVHIF